MKDIISEVMKIFPPRLKAPLSAAIGEITGLHEIRLVAEESVFFVTENGIFFVSEDGKLTRFVPLRGLIPSFSELDEITDRSVGYSGFLRENELKNGYITYSQGIRIGLCCDQGPDFGRVGKITSINIRIPFCGKTDYSINFSDILSFSSGLLIAGAPSSGKTTLLREIAKKLSSGFLGEYKKVTVIDERGELSQGGSLGPCTDIIRGRKKADAILHAVRLMSPRYIICDEIGSVEETKSILEGLNSGVSFIASMHAQDVSSLARREQLRLLLRENVFDKAVFLSGLSPGKITGIYSYGELMYEITGTLKSLHGYCDDGILPFVSSRQEAEIPEGAAVLF